MPRPHASAVISAPVEEVWPLVRDFAGLHRWHPAVAEGSLDSSSAAEVGAAGLGALVERFA